MISMHRIPRSDNIDLSEGEEGDSSIDDGRDYGENEGDY